MAEKDYRKFKLAGDLVLARRSHEDKLKNKAIKKRKRAAHIAANFFDSLRQKGIAI